MLPPNTITVLWYKRQLVQHSSQRYIKNLHQTSAFWWSQSFSKVCVRRCLPGTSCTLSRESPIRVSPRNVRRRLPIITNLSCVLRMVSKALSQTGGGAYEAGTVLAVNGLSLCVMEGIVAREISSCHYHCERYGIPAIDGENNGADIPIHLPRHSPPARPPDGRRGSLQEGLMGGTWA